MKLENFNLGTNQLIHLGMLFSCNAASISPANFTALQVIYNCVKRKL